MPNSEIYIGIKNDTTIQSVMNDSEIFSTSFAESIEGVPSPELFESDSENDTFSNNISRLNGNLTNTSQIEPSPIKLSQAELVEKSDNCLLSKVNKFLTGVPPPPKHTICQKDCNDILLDICRNNSYFWTNFPVQNDVRFSTKPSVVLEACDQSNDSAYPDSEIIMNDSYDDTAATILSNDEQSKDSAILEETNSGTTDSFTTSNMTILEFNKSKKLSRRDVDEKTLLGYNSIHPDVVASLGWQEAYLHKAFGIHYNRNKSIEEFETLSMKLCERYIGAETQSTCNIWFTKQAVNSKPRNLLARPVGQSPGKRLSHLAKRRRTFSSANLQCLTLVDKKQLILNVRKPNLRKGKSPRGKSPRGKSPRGKSPRSSAKKRAIKRLTLDGPSPYKSKLETSKRALFQSPPTDRAGPSKLLSANGTNSQKIKRALFPTPKKEDEGSNCAETRKRKNEETLEGPRFKWAKSLSFDCPRDLDKSAPNAWDCERRSAGNILPRSNSDSNCGKIELSQSHRKKLLWAVAEALRNKGIGMGHPRFKQYASNLARTVKKYMPDLENRNIPRKPGSTSDRMLKLAKHHVLFLLETKSAH